MRDEFYKIAKEKKPPVPGERDVLLGTGGWLGSKAMKAVGRKGNAALVEELMNETPTPSDVRTRQINLFKKMVGGSGVDVYGKQLTGHGPAAIQALKTKPAMHIAPEMIGMPGIIAHELGHVDVAKGRIGKFVGGLPGVLGGMAARKVSPYTALAGGLLTGASKEEDEGKRRTGTAMAAAPTVLGQGQQLADEAGASLYGLRRLRQAGATPAEMSAARKHMTKAFGTYGTAALVPAGTALGLYGIGRGAAGMVRRRAHLNSRAREEAPPDASS